MRVFVAVAGLSTLLAACSSGTQTAPGAAPSPVTSAPSAAAAPVAVAPAPVPAPAPATPAAMNPVGAYSVATEVNGGPVTGTLTIAGGPGAYTGKFVSDAFPEMPVSNVVVKGQVMNLAVESPQGSALMTLTFKGADFSGQWELGGQTGPITGKKLK
jgi:nucleoid-associated protein YgaU